MLVHLAKKFPHVCRIKKGGRERQIKGKQVMCMHVCVSFVPQNFVVLLRQCLEPNRNLLSITEPFASCKQCLKIFPPLCLEIFQCPPVHEPHLSML